MKIQSIDSDNHGMVMVPTTDYLKLLEVWRVFNDEAVLVSEWGGRDMYCLPKAEVLILQSEQIASLQAENKKLSGQIAAFAARQPQNWYSPRPAWYKFWK